VTAELVDSIVKEEVARLKASGSKLPFERAAKEFTKVAVDNKFEEFLTTPLYETF
jgi:malate synthase